MDFQLGDSNDDHGEQYQSTIEQHRLKVFQCGNSEKSETVIGMGSFKKKRFPDAIINFSVIAI